jgi:hypothetical protein
MTQDEIIEMARQADWPDSLVAPIIMAKLSDFAKLVAAHEQDRCCAIVFSQCDSDNVAQRTVDAIRKQQ